jgi:hypothetical protein
LDDATLIRAYNNWARRRGELDKYPLATGITVEGGHIILNEKRKEEDGVENRMLARFKTDSKQLEIISGDPTQRDLTAILELEEIFALAKNE